MPELTAERVRELFDYDPLTGAMLRRVTRGGTARKGVLAGYKTKYGYLSTRVDGRAHFNHRLIWLLVTGQWPNNYIDHINGVRDDNRLVNLRDVTRACNGENLHRAHADNPSGLLGVHKYARTKSFTAKLYTNGKHIHLGYYASPEAAHAAYLEAKRQLHAGSTI